ncbi:U3 small nucleolar ribonucleoprotein protein MPP10 isoform X1 [Oncorhynchus kisutch]|uniref:U3 small nucleolar ribonucleoprotein protein MPP10 isoform X1 n=1 Tax=Oncorhynchus kisutch TaxID=8019 RepID=UPI0012DC7173|nr:U3 small nucleolar ribonucleoprotein protein MPP10 isoform X1 [Oncorhynchus kisutch]
MATVDIGNTLECCLKLLNIKTAHPEHFLSLQGAVATDFTYLTKTLYDLHKTHEPAGSKGSPLDQLVVENFDEEQIWQELELQNTAVLKHFETAVSQAALDTALSILFDEEDADEEPDEGVDQDGEDLEEETRDGDLEDDGQGEEPHMLKTAMDALRGDNTDEDSDVDFDVDALEKQAKQKKCSAARESKPLGPPSEVDDRFFKLSEMESFLDDMDRREGKEGDGDVDYFQDLPSGDDDDVGLFSEDVSSKKTKKTSTLKSSRNLKYKDFFDAVDDDPAQTADQSDAEDEDNSIDGMQDEDDDEEEEKENEDFVEDEECRQAKEALKRVTFNLPGESDASEGEDMADIFGGKSQNTTEPESKSSFEKRQDKMAEKIQDLEKAAMGEKPWQLTGEVSAQARPENSLLEVDVAFDSASRMGTYHMLSVCFSLAFSPVGNGLVFYLLQVCVPERVLVQSGNILLCFLSAPAVTEETTLQLEDIIKQRIKDQAWDDVVRKEKPKEEVFEYKKRLTLDHEKSKLSLAEVYEQEYLKQNQQKTEDEENPAHVEIQKLMDSLFLKLDALSNFHFTPKPPVPEVKVVSNLPSIAMEEVAPVSASSGSLLAPEEVKEKNKAGDVLGDSEKTSTDKKRERRKKKKVKRVKIHEKEKKQKLKEANRTGENKKPSKAEVAENLKKLTKGGKATLLKDEGKDKALRSSSAFFSQLQDQVKSQIKGAKDPGSKKKKHKEVSASKLKL